MGHKEFQANISLTGAVDAVPGSADIRHGATVTARLKARLFAGRLDRDVDDGIAPLPGSPLAVHIARLTSLDEREALARSLRHALAEVDDEGRDVCARIPVDLQRLATCRDVIDDITLRLHAPRPVRARGMARLRMLLSDGSGPLYGTGRGSLAAALRGVLAAL